MNRSTTRRSSITVFIQTQIILVILEIGITSPHWIGTIFVKSETGFHSSFGTGCAIAKELASA